MPVEIERKFLVKNDDFKLNSRPVEISQGYMVISDNRTIRIRIVETKGFITIKSKISTVSRHEYEYEIPVNEALEMLNNLCEHKINKVRHYLDYENKLWEIDEFQGDNEGLTVAEIELLSEDENFTKPIWLGDEVTADERYYNFNLSRFPFRNW